MKDLLLFEKLRAGASEVDEVLPLLAQLAARPLAERVPWLGVLSAAVRHQDERMRRAALEVLRGADGRLALRAFVDGLDDDAAAVRLAAVAGLRAIAPHDPWRWAHAVFHSRADVRRACLSLAAGEEPSELCFYLLADPACREQLEPLLGGDDEGPRLPVPSTAYPAIVAFVQRGFLTTAGAVRLLERMPVVPIVAHALAGARRTPHHIGRLLDPPTDGDDGTGVEEARASGDGFDGLFDIMAQAHDARRVTKLCGRLSNALANKELGERRRAAAAICAALLNTAEPEHDRVHVELASLGAELDPSCLLSPVIPLALRKKAAAALAHIPHPIVRPDVDVVRMLLRELVVGPPIELAAAAGVVRLAGTYRALLEAVPIAALLDAMRAVPERAAAILLVPDGSKHGRKWMLAQIAAHDEAMHSDVLAWLATFAPTDKLVFIEELEAWQALALAMRLTEVEREAPLKTNKRLRLASLIGARLETEDAEVGRQRLTQLAEHLLSQADPEVHPFGRSLLEELARALGGESFAIALSGLSDPLLRRLVELVPLLSRLSYGCELALASVLFDHPDPVVRAWAGARAPLTEPPPPPTAVGLHRLTRDDARKLRTCHDAALVTAVAPWRRVPSVGLAEALAKRASVPVAAELCAALLGCHDDCAVVATMLERAGVAESAVAAELEGLAIGWENRPSVPWLASAWLWRWERHAFAVGAQLTLWPGGPAAFLRDTLALPSLAARQRAWRAMGEAVWLWSARDAARVRTIFPVDSPNNVGAESVSWVVEQLDSDVDVGAAKLFVGMYRAGVAPALEALAGVKAMLPDVSAEARAILKSVVRDGGLALRRRAPRQRAASPVDVAAIRTSDDVAAIEAWCRSPSDRVVQEAALRGIEIGAEALERMACVMMEPEPVPCLQTLVESVPLWPEGPPLSRLRAAVESALPDELRFRLSLAFDERGEGGFVERALTVVAQSATDTWFRPADYDRLAERAGPFEVAVRLALSPQPHAYTRAVRQLLGKPRGDARVLAALRSFLLSDSERLDELRREAAFALQAHGDATGFALCLAHALDPDGSYGLLFKGVAPSYVPVLVDAVLYAGPRAVSEARALLLLDTIHVDAVERDRAWERWLVDATLEQTATRIMNIFTTRRMHAEERTTALAKVARVFAWGTREGLPLTRRRHTVHMSEREHLGYTRFDQDSIWVSPLPILRGDRHGEQIVEALILHEIGHHRHHRGVEEQKVWARAEKEGIFGLLNLVADEHLERNLRALDKSYGDRLKRLAAHAFRHAHRDIRVAELLAMLGHEAFDVLSGCRLGLAQGTEKVQVESGKLLSLMEHRGMAFARFMRALRMGLGDRYGDPLVAEALRLFPKSFRKSSMEGLYEVAVRLQRIFGWEASLANTYGGHETADSSAREETRWGRGIQDDEVQREVERVLNPTKRRSGASSGASDKLWINVSADHEFELIHHVERVTPDRLRHRTIARDVARHARALRTVLERLGLSRVPAHRRMKGTRLDRGRLTALVTRRDPRVLVASEVVVHTDLFLGVVVDCSGSMEGGDNIGKARRFACLVAEAAAGLAGVDARFFGFTDSVIYDAGDARRCAAACLEAGGGNNDAAALFHAATVAKRSRRKAKVLVMVSDGLPTECSTEALKALVVRVTRAGICVAQVAVAPLEEVCFPHHVLLEGELDGAVRRFGQVVAKLVSRALG